MKGNLLMQNVFGFYVHNIDDHHVKILITFLLCSNYKSHYLDIDRSNNGFSLQKFDGPSLNAQFRKLNFSATNFLDNLQDFTLRKKCPHSELFWSAFSRIRTEYRERYGVSLRIQCEYEKIRTRITLNRDTFHNAFSLNQSKKHIIVYTRNMQTVNHVDKWIDKHVMMEHCGHKG